MNTKATSKSHDRIEAFYLGEDRKAGFKFAMGGAFRDLIWSHFGHAIVWQKFLVRVRKSVEDDCMKTIQRDSAMLRPSFLKAAGRSITLIKQRCDGLAR
jgi:hypothetical protein